MGPSRNAKRGHVDEALAGATEKVGLWQRLAEYQGPPRLSMGEQATAFTLWNLSLLNCLNVPAGPEGD